MLASLLTLGVFRRIRARYPLIGAIIYEGPSMLDGAPIVVVATGIGTKSSDNEKTGKMIQTWIMRADIDPLSAIRSDDDSSVCGDCVHRGQSAGKGRSCYVLVFQAPLGVWRAYKRGRYVRADSAQKRAELGRDRMVRCGSYGDPASVPAYVWGDLLSGSEGWTGYTHSPTRGSGPALKGVCMASADTLRGARKLQRSGWRTFRVMTGSEHVSKGETLCPASEEAGQLTSCEKCSLCQGSYRSGAKSVAIHVHGTPGSNARKNIQRRLQMAKA